MALASTGVFEVQGGVGSDSNAGYYDPAISGAGTDLTYPTSSPVTISDLVIHASTTTKVKSASAVALSAVPNGNSMIISSGTGFTTSAIPYVVTGNDGTYWILDRAAGTAGSTGGSAIAGGALKSLTPFATSGLLIFGHKIHVKGVSPYFDLGSGATLVIPNVAQTATSPPVSIRGYGTTRGDRTQTQCKMTAGSFSYGILSSSPLDVYDLAIDASGSSYSRCIQASQLNAYRCKFTNCYGAIAQTGAGVNVRLAECEISYCADRILTDGSGYTGTFELINCTIRNNSASAFQGTPNNPAVIHVRECLFYGNTGMSMVGMAAGTIERNVFYGSGVALSFGTANTFIMGPQFKNNIIALSPASGLSADSLCTAWMDNFNGNAYYSNTSGPRSSYVGATSGDTDDIILTADPFVNAAGGDFRFNNNAGGGAELRGMGYPRSWPGLDSIPNARDMGAYQHATPPLGLTVDNSGAHPVLTWDADPLATNYYVKVYNDSGGSTPPTTGTTYTVIAVIAAGTTTYTHTAAASGTNYYEVSSSH